MAKANLLTAKAVLNAAPGVLSDGGGLLLLTKPSGAKSWVLRVQHEGKRRDLGLGAFPAVTLAQARSKATTLRQAVKEGAEPLAEKRAAKARRAAAGERTFAKVAALVHGQRKFRTPALSQRWIGRLQRFAFPHFGDVAVHKVDGPMVLGALQPLWNDKPETARRVRQLVGSVLDYAHAMGWRERSPGLAALTKQAFPAHEGATHHPAVEYTEAADVLARLRAARESVGRLALIFTIYTAARSGETRGATWGEFDLSEGVWRIPAARMKMKRDHAVPLSAPARAILERIAVLRRTNGAPDELVFPGAKAGQPLSDMTLAKATKLAAPGTTVHGWRSTFCDWAGETTAFPSNVIEAALAHAVGNATTQAYQRGDLLAKRRDVMDAWAAYLAPVAADNVVTLATRRRA